MAKADYDLIVIGGGAAGFVASKLARGFGKTVAMIEKERIGGTCTNTGCIPSKALIRAARAAYELRRLNEFGLSVEGQLTANTEQVMDRVRSVVAAVYQGHEPQKFTALGIDLIFGSPRFLDPNRIIVNDGILSSRRFIIATGSRASIPAVEGLRSAPFLTNENLFALDKLPGSLIVLGGGAIGIEMAAAFNRLGVRTTVIETLDRILLPEDRELTDLLSAHLAAEGLSILTRTRILRVASSDNGVRVIIENGGVQRELSAERLLVAAGRAPNTEGFDLERAGVSFDNRGIKTDRYMRTTSRPIYACGDVVGPYRFSHMAEYQAVLACANAFLPVRRKADYRHVVWSTFTDPELAHAGMTEEEARDRLGGSISVYRYDYRNLDRAKTDRQNLGLAKYICDGKGRLVGAHILGSHATEVLHEAQLAKALGIPFRRIQQVIHAYPSYSDVLRQASKANYVDRLLRNPLLKLLKFLFSRGSERP